MSERGNRSPQISAQPNSSLAVLTPDEAPFAAPVRLVARAASLTLRARPCAQ